MRTYCTLPLQQALAKNYNTTHLIWPVHLRERALPLVTQDNFLLSQASQPSRNFSRHPGRVAGTLLQPGALWFTSCTEWCSLTSCQTSYGICMKLFIKQTWKSITSSHRMLAHWQMANQPASENQCCVAGDLWKSCLLKWGVYPPKAKDAEQCRINEAAN